MKGLKEKLEELLSTEQYPLLTVDEYKAAKRIEAAFNRLDNDEEVFTLLMEVLLERYEEISTRINQHLRESEHEEVCVAAKELTSSIRNVVSDSIVQTAVKLQEAGKNEDTVGEYKNWLHLHDRLSPVMRVMRRLQ